MKCGKQESMEIKVLFYFFIIDCAFHVSKWTHLSWFKQYSVVASSSGCISVLKAQRAMWVISSFLSWFQWLFYSVYSAFWPNWNVLNYCSVSVLYSIIPIRLAYATFQNLSELGVKCWDHGWQHLTTLIWLRTIFKG